MRTAIIGTLFVVMAMGSANALVIDSFDEPADASNRTLIEEGCGAFPCTDNSNYSGGGIVGGTRQIDTTVVGLRPLMPPDDWAVEAIVSNGGAFTHSQTTGVGSNTAVTWNANGAVGGLNEDLTDDGVAFRLQVVSVDVDALWSLTLNDGTQSATVEFDTEGQIFDFERLVFFSQFLAVNPLLNLTSIDSIVFVSNAQNNFAFDTTIDQLDTIPEPASLALLGMGIIGLGVAGRRGRKAA